MVYTTLMAAWIFAGDATELDFGFGVHAQQASASSCLPDEPRPSREEIEADWERRRASSTLHWQIRSHHCEAKIAVGDRVFIWVSDDHRNGIVRIGRVTELRIRPNIDPWRQDASSAFQTSWATLTLEGTEHPRRIRRNAMLRDELLGALDMVLRPFNARSNMEITHAQELRLIEMWNALVPTTSG